MPMADIHTRMLDRELKKGSAELLILALVKHLEDAYQEWPRGGPALLEAQGRTLGELSENELLARVLRRSQRRATPQPSVSGQTRRTNMLTDIGKDLRYGARMLLKKP